MATLVGQTVSHYRILEHLGGGGMGVVYKAQDLKLDRPVALKFLSPERTQDPQARARFTHEAKAASALQHNNICTVHDIDETTDGALFIVMDLYDGETLKEKLDQGPLQISEAIRLAVQIADGLAEAHSAGIVHRDIKPANIHITKGGIAKILDFGLAKLGGRALLTTAGSTMGTAAYMSPEQARGEQTDHRTDIWSLGVIMYEMVTGQRPFRGEYEPAVIYNILHDDPEPIENLRPEVPERLISAITRALAKQPSARPESAEQLLHEIRNPDVREPAAPSEKSIAVLPFTNMSADPDQDYFCDGLAEEIINSLSQLGDLHVVARTSSFAFKDQRTDVREIGRKLNVRYVVEGSVRTGGGKLRITAQLINVNDGFHLWSERFDRMMEDVFAIQDEVTMQIVKALSVKVGTRERSLVEKGHGADLESYTLCLKGRHFWSTYTEEGFKKGIQCCEQAIARNSNYALAYAGLAVCYTFLGYYLYLNPKEEFKKAEAAAKKALQLDDTLAEAHLALAWVKMCRDRDWNGAEAEFNRAIVLNPGFAIARAFHAALLSVLARYEEAVAEAETALALDPLSPLCGGTLGLRYYYARQYQKAVDIFQKTLELVPQFAPGFWMLSLPLAAAKRIDEAIFAAEKSVELLSEPDPLSRSICGLIYALSPNRKDDARRVTEELMVIAKRRPISSFFMGMIYVGLAEKNQAFSWFEKALRDGEPLLMWARADPIIQDGLKEDPRYHDLLQRLGLGDGA